jgi:hypothetical protein
VPDREHDPPRLPERRSRKQAGDERETGKGEHRCERRDEERQERSGNATLAGREEAGLRPGRRRWERSRRRSPRRRVAGRTPAGGTNARPHPGRRRPGRRGGHCCRRGGGRRSEACVTAGGGRTRHGARARCRGLWAVASCHRVARGEAVDSGRNAGHGGRDTDACHHRGRRDNGWRRGRREVRRAGGRRRPRCEGGERRGCAERLHHGGLRRRASPRRDGIDLREGGVDRGRQVGQAGRRARGPGDSRRRQCTAGGCRQRPCAN